MKMEPGRPASPTGGPCPDPEPGGFDWPGIAPTSTDPSPCLGLSALDPADLSAERVPGASYLPPSQADCPDPDPDPDQPLTELGPLFFWTKEPEDYGPQSCQESASLCAQDFSHSNHGRGEVDFFPSLPSSTVELTLEVGPGDAHQPSDLSQTHSLASEPTGCAEDGPRLRAVFDALDGDGDGFVRMEDFVQFATVYGAEQVTRRALLGPQHESLALRVSTGLTRSAVFAKCMVRTSGPACSFYSFLPSPLVHFYPSSFSSF